LSSTRLARLIVTTGALVLGAIAGAATAVAEPMHVLPAGNRTFEVPPTTAFCQQNFAINCYQPFQLTRAYELNSLHASGVDGRGETIVIVDSHGSPTIAKDLQTFDKTFGLPNPPSLTIRQDAGPVPAFDPGNPDDINWGVETTLDVEWSHVFAPGANILLEETPVSETEGVHGFPQIVEAENYVIDHHLGEVISQSFGATEQTFPNAEAILNLRSAFKNAARNQVTVLGGSGDTGATNYTYFATSLYPYRVNSWPSSDPLVTSVGGTMLTLNGDGVRLARDVVWNDGFGAGGGTVSSVFARPWYQDGLRSVVGDSRGTPDISLSAAVNGAVDIYYTFQPGFNGWNIVGGTSEATPEFAGIVAMTDQVAGHPLGELNRYLYRIPEGTHGLLDVAQGNNSFGGVRGYNAGPGYDLASGLGTVDAARFVPALASLAH
jgi:subtilase family serine protease